MILGGGFSQETVVPAFARGRAAVPFSPQAGQLGSRRTLTSANFVDWASKVSSRPVKGSP